MARFHQWTRARSLLRQAVTAIDAELAPRGYYLSMADDSVHPHDLAAVEIQLFLHGNPCDTLLDITVSSDGRQLARDLGGNGKHLHIKLPPIGRATLSTYSTALLAYIEQAIVQFGERSEEQCRVCGLALRGCHVRR